MSVCEISHKTLYHTHPRIDTAAEMGEYNPSEKGMESETNLSLTLSTINPERS